MLAKTHPSKPSGHVQALAEDLLGRSVAYSGLRLIICIRRRSLSQIPKLIVHVTFTCGERGCDCLGVGLDVFVAFMVPSPNYVVLPCPEASWLKHELQGCCGLLPHRLYGYQLGCFLRRATKTLGH